MMRKILLLLASLALLLGACQFLPARAPVAPAAPAEPAPPPMTLSDELRPVLEQLTGAALLTGEPVAFGYPDERLFSVGAVLPLAGGAEILDPLGDFLLSRPETRWRATVRASTSHGLEYDGQLARKRLELLQRYLRNRGVAEAQVDWRAVGGSGIPFELRLLPPAQPPAAATSSGEKR